MQRESQNKEGTTDRHVECKTTDRQCTFLPQTHVHTFTKLYRQALRFVDDY